jgi:hypothetical protein
MADIAAETYHVPLPGGQRVVTITGPFPLTTAEWRHVMTVLTAMLPGLVKDPGPAPDADPGYWPAAAGKDGER